MLDKTLTGKVALVTGGARGIGRATVRKLAAHGADLAIVYYNSSDEAESLAKEVQDLGQRAHCFQANVADSKSIKEMVQQFSEKFQSLDILVSNAASGVLRPAMEMTLKHWRWCMETNAFALNEITKQMKPFMPKGARVIALSSLGASRAIPNYAFIGASKAALESLVRGLSIELAADDISVNTVSAGVVDTDALKYFPNREQVLNNYRAHALGEKTLDEEDVADAVYLLCLPEARMIKGQTLFVDAGYAITG